MLLIFDLRCRGETSLIAADLHAKVLGAFPAMTCLGEGAFLIPDASSITTIIQRLRTASLISQGSFPYWIFEVSSAQKGQVSANELSDPTTIA